MIINMGEDLSEGHKCKKNCKLWTYVFLPKPDSNNTTSSLQKLFELKIRTDPGVPVASPVNTRDVKSANQNVTVRLMTLSTYFTVSTRVTIFEF